MSEEQDPIRKQLIEARRGQILDAAGSVFAERGFARATTKEIARVAGVSEGTIYNYFASKYDLLIGLMERLTRIIQFDRMLSDGLAVDVRQFLTDMFRWRRAFIQEYWPLLRVVMSEVLINPELGKRYYQDLVIPTIAQLEQHVQARVALGQIRPVNVPLFTRVVTAISLGLFLGFFLYDPVVNEQGDRLADELTEILFEGLDPLPSQGAQAEG